MTETSLAVLGYRVRAHVALKYLGLLSLSLAFMAGGPAVVGFLSDDPALALRCAIVAAAFLVVGLTLRRLRAPTRIQANEAMVVVCLTFLIGGAAMSWPLMASGLPFVDALFEAVSGITTTGLSTVGAVEGQSFGFAFCRAWLQWYGGLAIIVLALALVLQPGIAARRLAGEGEYENPVIGTRARARRMLIVYGALTLCAVVAIWAAGADLSDAVVYALSAISTGGFSSHDDSIAGFGGPIQTVILAVSVLGAISFALQYRAARGDWRTLLSDPEVQCLAVMGATIAALLFAAMTFLGGVGAGRAAHGALSLAISAQTTTGFATMPVAELDAGSKGVLIASMLIGGDMGSTAGGIKIFRLLIVLRLVQLLIARAALPPHAVTELRVAGRPVEASEIQISVGIVLLYLGVAALSWLACLAAGLVPLDALFEVASALGTVGLSAGIAAPGLAPGLKLLLCADMLMGRLEIVAFLILFHPSTWFGRKAADA